MFAALSVAPCLVGMDAQASDYLITYVGKKLSPSGGGAGIPGVKKVVASWVVASLPDPGKCLTYYNSVASFTDGVNTLGSLNNAGYKVNGDYVYICAGKKSTTLTMGNYELELVTNSAMMPYMMYSSVGYVDTNTAGYSSAVGTCEINDDACQSELMDEAQSIVKRFHEKVQK